ncbi:MAG: condensation domain-containing protein, partial [Myxococcota bacterium]
VAGYIAAAAGRTPALAALPIQYGDYARWQRSDAYADLLKTQREWWLAHLAGSPKALNLPLDRPRRTDAVRAGDTVRFRLDPETSEGVRRLAGECEGTTPFMVLLAGFSALLHRLTGDTDICLGTAIAGRTRPETASLIGLFANTLVLRVDASARPSFRTLLARARTTAVGAFAHPDVPFEQLVESLGVQRDSNLHPLFQVLFLLQNVPPTGNPLSALDLEIKPRAASNRRARFDLTISWFEDAGCFSGHAEYATALFDRATIEAWCSAYTTLLQAAVAEPDVCLTELPLGLSPSFRCANASEGDEVYASVADRFTAMAALRKEAPAVGYEGRWWSYRELDQAADRVARRLVS